MYPFRSKHAKLTSLAIVSLIMLINNRLSAQDLPPSTVNVIYRFLPDGITKSG